MGNFKLALGSNETKISARRTRNLAVSLWPLAGFVLGRPEFKSSAMDLYTIETLNLTSSFSYSQVLLQSESESGVFRSCCGHNILVTVL